ncbi:MAG: hypothetical protein WEA82_00255 [Idiomarina sp.]
MSVYHSLQWSADADHYPLAVKPEVTVTDHKLNWHQPAVLVMDDFLKRIPLRFNRSTPLPVVEQKMNQSTERYACVVDSAGVLIGMLSKKDIHGPKSIALATQRQSSWGELVAEDMMTAVSKMPQVTMLSLSKARIGDAAATLQQANAEYLLIHDPRAGEMDSVCGVISRLGIVEHTGESVRLYHWASSFSEIVDAL